MISTQENLYGSIFLEIKVKNLKVEIHGVEISLDDNTGILYVTTGNPANYFIGVDRPGLNEYTNSVIAIDINKKKELWKFQETTHDLWDLDIPAAPILTTINFDDQLIDVVIAITKLGNTLIFDRANGSNLNDYISVSTRSSKIKVEMTSTKQKYFLKPPAFSKIISYLEMYLVLTKMRRRN